jgi:hypothetical protein
MINDLKKYQEQAFELWFSGGSCTGGNSEMEDNQNTNMLQEPKRIQDSKNEDDEFHRIERENKLKESS